jgi:hypothetical protein
MRLHNSYTLSSKKKLPNTKRISKTVVTGLWIFFFLLVIDFAVNFLFPYPLDPHIRLNNSASTLTMDAPSKASFHRWWGNG